MPASSSAAVPPTAAPVGDRSSDSEEYEYEEVEIEEEIEVEEEVSDDEGEEEEIEEEEEAEEEELAEEKQKEEEKRIREDVLRSIENGNGVKIPPNTVPVGNQSPTGSNSEEYEYKEVEIEEEIEVEEEVSDDEEEKNEEVEEEEAHEEVLEEEEEQKEGKKQGKRSGEDAMRSIEDQDDVKRKDKITSDDECDGGIMTADIINPINESSKPLTVGDSVDESEPDKVPRSEEQTTQMDITDVDDARLKEPRLDDDVNLTRPRSLSPAMEVNEGNKRPTLVCDFFAKGWCIKGSSCRFRHIKDSPTNVVDQLNEPQKSQPQDEGVRESTGTTDDLATSATPSTLVKCSSEVKPGSQKVNPNPVTTPSVTESLSKPFMGPNTHITSWTSFAPNHFGLHNHNYNSNYHGTVWPMTSTILTSSSRKSGPKGFSNDWELSKPFKSKFLMSQGICTPDIQYDPIRDSIEQPTNLVDKSSKLSSSSRLPSVSATHSPLQEKLKTGYGSDRISIGSHVNDNDNDNDEDMDVDSNEIGDDTKHENTKSESKGKGKRQIGDVIQASEVQASGHYSLQPNDDGPTKEVNNYKLDFDAEGDMHRESKSLRHFRAALIDFVKELVRPSWRDGKLSKDAHKMVVKKAVDKVLTSLPPEHVPKIKESIDTYLTSSQPKLMKLVEGYVEKYGKL